MFFCSGCRHPVHARLNPYILPCQHTYTLAEASPFSSLPHVSTAPYPMFTVSASTPPMESFFSPISLFPSVPSSMLVSPMMNAALSVGRLYRSPTFTRKLGSTNPKWNLAHTYPFQSLAFGAFSQALNVNILPYFLFDTNDPCFFCYKECYTTSCYVRRRLWNYHPTTDSRK